MTFNKIFNACLCAPVFLTTIVAAQEPSFTPLGDIPGGSFFSRAMAISPDGTAVVGESVKTEPVRRAFLWTADNGMIDLGAVIENHESHALGSSSGGRVVVGWTHNELHLPEAFIWTEAEGMVLLGGLPGSDPNSIANAVSADGSVVVGRLRHPDGFEIAFRWTAVLGFHLVYDSQSGLLGNVARDVSGDGQMIAGILTDRSQTSAFRFVTGVGIETLGHLDGQWSNGRSVSFGGNFVVGDADRAAPNEIAAFRWSEQSGMVDLGDAGPCETPRNEGRGVSADGVVVGSSRDSSCQSSAFLWTQDSGMRRLQDILVNDLDLDLTGWHLSSATDISADGRSIVGFAINPNGDTEAWLAYLGPSCRADFNNDGVVNTLDVLSFLNAFAQESWTADFNFDGTIDTLDFLAYLNVFSEGC